MNGRRVDTQAHCKHSSGEPAAGITVKVGTVRFPLTDVHGRAKGNHSGGPQTVWAYRNVGTAQEELAAGPFNDIEFNGASRFCLKIQLKNPAIPGDIGKCDPPTSGFCPPVARVRAYSFEGTREGGKVYGGVRLDFVGPDGRITSYLTDANGAAYPVLPPEVYLILTYKLVEYKDKNLLPVYRETITPFSQPKELDMLTPRDYILEVPAEGVPRVL